jgi:NTE family protein
MLNRINTALTIESEDQQLRQAKGRPKRALILQGGGALGAYEAGAFRALYEKLYTEDEPLFDIVAGTSIGAINGAILVSHVIQNKSWEGADEKLLAFWTGERGLTSWDFLGSPDFAEFNKFLWSAWWMSLQLNPLTWFGRLAPPEAARRYYTAKFAEYVGVPTVCQPDLPSLFDTKYLDNFFPPTNAWFKSDPNLLKMTLERFCTFPIKANGNKEDYPRLLTISTDILETVSVIFDSYLLKSEILVGDERHYTLEYHDGILADHVMASASVPINYNYVHIPDTTGQKHYLWDGGLLSNTPLSEMLQMHFYYYFRRIVDEKGGYSNLTEDDWNKIAVPDIKEVYMLNVNPNEQPDAPTDHDNALSRCLDITLADKSAIIEQTLDNVGEIIDIVGSYRDLAIRLANKLQEVDGQKGEKLTDTFKSYISPDAYKRVLDSDKPELALIHETILGRVLYSMDSSKDKKIQLKNALEKVLEKEIKAVKAVKMVPEHRPRSLIGMFEPPQLHHDSTKLPYYDLDRTTFRVNNIIYAQRAHDANDIANKMLDFSKGTVNQLIGQGYEDAEGKNKAKLATACNCNLSDLYPRLQSGTGPRIFAASTR